MRVCGPLADEVLTNDPRCHLLGCLNVALRKQVRVSLEHRLGPVT
jgi:hypothetical protein